MIGETAYKEFIIDDTVLEEGNIQAIIEPLWWTVSIYDGESEMYEALERYTEPQQYVWAIQHYLSIVEKEGHEKFFTEEVGIVWQLALEGLKVIGCTQAEDILNEALQLIGGRPSFDREQRLLEIRRHNPDFEDVDEAFNLNSSALECSLMEYIHKNHTFFYFNGEVEVPIDYIHDDNMYIPGFGSMSEISRLYYR